jgi:hypothetical protein
MALAKAFSEAGLVVTPVGIGDRVLYDANGRPISVDRIDFADFTNAEDVVNGALSMVTPDSVFHRGSFMEVAYERVVAMVRSGKRPRFIVDNSTNGPAIARGYRELDGIPILVPQHLPNDLYYGRTYASLKNGRTAGVQVFGFCRAHGVEPFIHHALLHPSEILRNRERRRGMQPQPAERPKRLCWVGRADKRKGLFEAAKIAMRWACLSMSSYASIPTKSRTGSSSKRNIGETSSVSEARSMSMPTR